MSTPMGEAERIEACAADWLARRESESWSDTHQQALDAWLDASVAHQVAYLRLESAWQRSDRMSALRAPQLRGPHTPAPRARAVPLHPPVAAGRRMALGMMMSVAAAGVAWLGWQQMRPAPDGGALYSTAVGARETVNLVDGSHLTLNTDTRLRAAVGSEGRKVWLDQGEAFFEIAHDASRPFVVMAGDRRITVLGTRFSVRRKDSQVNVVVEDGRVQVEPQVSVANAATNAATTAAASAPTLVLRNQVLVARADNVLVLSRPAQQIANELSWRQGKLMFNQVTLAEAAAEFNRYNLKQLVITDPAVGQMRIGGSFQANGIAGFAALLQQGFGLVVTEQGDEIRISG